jgi:hypothetical protein
MATKRITVQINDQPVDLVLKSARVADGVRRSELMAEAAQGDMTTIRSQHAFFTYPTCVAAVSEPDWVRDMSLDQFLADVDENDMLIWQAAAFEMNPQWVRSLKSLGELGEEAEKKTGTP